MAIDVNDVYQTVLFILNKEQRGYMTPPEFNQVAAQVQQGIFEKYFEDLNFYLRSPVVASEYADRIKSTEEKIALFEISEQIDVDSTITGQAYSPFIIGENPNSLLPNEGTTYPVHRLGTLTYETNNLLELEIQKCTVHELTKLRRSKLTAPTAAAPLYTLENSVATPQSSNQARVFPNSINKITVNYVRKPKNPIWAFKIGTQGQYEYVEPGVQSEYPNSANGSVHFEISDQEKTEVVLAILMYAGVIIRDPQIVGAAEKALQQEEVTEKS